MGILDSPLVEERYFKQQDCPWNSKRCLYNVMNKSAAAEAGLKEGDYTK
jgi:hypothetical protein